MHSKDRLRVRYLFNVGGATVALRVMKGLIWCILLTRHYVGVLHANGKMPRSLWYALYHHRIYTPEYKLPLSARLDKGAYRSSQGPPFFLARTGSALRLVNILLKERRGGFCERIVG